MIAKTDDWCPGPMEDRVGLLGAWVATWNADHPEPGDHSAEQMRARHGAVDIIDELLRELHELRQALVTEGRIDGDVLLARPLPSCDVASRG